MQLGGQHPCNRLISSNAIGWSSKCNYAHRLESENQRIKAENERLLERFIRWQYNAQKRGLSQAVLDAYLPVIDRDSSEKN